MRHGGPDRQPDTYMYSTLAQRPCPFHSASAALREGDGLTRLERRGSQAQYTRRLRKCCMHAIII